MERKYVLSFTPNHGDSKSFLLALNSHYTVDNTNKGLLSFNPWGQYAADIIDDMKQARKVPHGLHITDFRSGEVDNIVNGKINNSPTETTNVTSGDNSNEGIELGKHTLRSKPLPSPVEGILFNISDKIEKSLAVDNVHDVYNALNVFSTTVSYMHKEAVSVGIELAKYIDESSPTHDLEVATAVKNIYNTMGAELSVLKHKVNIYAGSKSDELKFIDIIKASGYRSDKLSTAGNTKKASGTFLDKLANSLIANTTVNAINIALNHSKVKANSKSMLIKGIGINSLNVLSAEYMGSSVADVAYHVESEEFELLARAALTTVSEGKAFEGINIGTLLTTNEGTTSPHHESSTLIASSKGVMLPSTDKGNLLVSKEGITLQDTDKSTVALIKGASLQENLSKYTLIEVKEAVKFFIEGAKTKTTSIGINSTPIEESKVVNSKRGVKFRVYSSDALLVTLGIVSEDTDKSSVVSTKSTSLTPDVEDANVVTGARTERKSLDKSEFFLMSVGRYLFLEDSRLINAVDSNDFNDIEGASFAMPSGVHNVRLNESKLINDKEATNLEIEAAEPIKVHYTLNTRTDVADLINNFEGVNVEAERAKVLKENKGINHDSGEVDFTNIYVGNVNGDGGQFKFVGVKSELDDSSADPIFVMKANKVESNEYTGDDNMGIVDVHLDTLSRDGEPVGAKDVQLDNFNTGSTYSVKDIEMGTYNSNRNMVNPSPTFIEMVGEARSNDTTPNVELTLNDNVLVTNDFDYVTLENKLKDSIRKEVDQIVDYSYEQVAEVIEVEQDVALSRTVEVEIKESELDVNLEEVLTAIGVDTEIITEIHVVDEYTSPAEEVVVFSDTVDTFYRSNLIEDVHFEKHTRPSESDKVEEVHLDTDDRGFKYIEVESKFDDREHYTKIPDSFNVNVAEGLGYMNDKGYKTDYIAEYDSTSTGKELEIVIRSDENATNTLRVPVTVAEMNVSSKESEIGVEIGGSGVADNYRKLTISIASPDTATSDMGYKADMIDNTVTSRKENSYEVTVGVNGKGSTYSKVSIDITSSEAVDKYTEFETDITSTSLHDIKREQGVIVSERETYFSDPSYKGEDREQERADKLGEIESCNIGEVGGGEVTPTEPTPVTPPEPKNKIWSIMGKNYPSWQNWNPKKTR